MQTEKTKHPTAADIPASAEAVSRAEAEREGAFTETAIDLADAIAAVVSAEKENDNG